MIFDYYPGCTLNTKAKELDIFARKAAEKLGFELREIEDWQCCGAVYPMGADVVASKTPSVRALKASQDNGRALVTLCSACHHVLKRVNRDAAEDAEFRATLTAYDEELEYNGGTEVLHFLEVLRDKIGFDKVKAAVTNPLIGRKIGAYYGCMLLRPGAVMAFDDPESPTIIEDFIKALGATPVTYAMRNECCGGYISLAEKEMSAKMCHAVAEDAVRRGAEELITACPLCAYNVKKQAGDILPITYFTKLLAEALGLDGEEAKANA
ncbi:MAG: heterodisulfide reductase-related iron-sulfur binding cluster [Defluviitaleaceae bacterium]|nr:heterodisulfide reductase-related iron-sulfur binding cluster [Defluviitaleaceae bacterium]